jgi:inositol phosphorylceramide mannosyltransferase catalytic subunit
MRRALLLLILFVSAILCGAVYLVSSLIGLLFESGLQNAILPDTLASRSYWSEERRPIPKIIHQTWKNETIPEAWSIAQYSCRDLHPDYKYIVLSPLNVPLLIAVMDG